jgi:signal transduction histidine kinase
MPTARIDTATPPRLWALAAALGLALVAVTAIGLWQLRRDAVAGQARELSVLSLAVTGEIGRGLQEVDEGLAVLRVELGDGRLALQGADAGRRLRTRADLLPLVQSLWIVDRQGALLAASGAAPPPPLATFEPGLARLAPGRTAISAVFGAAGAEPQVALALPFTGAGGTSGWVLAALPARALLGAFSAATPAADARIGVFRRDGMRLAGSLATEPPPGDTQQLVDRRSLPAFGLRVVLTRELSAVLATWREVARGAALGVTLLLAVVAVALQRIQRADRRRSEAQQALQAQHTRSRRLEALGTLAGGVAHDFNNVLAAVLGYAEIARESAAAGSAQARRLDQVLQAALRGKSLVERILAFSRGGARRSTVFALQPVVEEVLTLLAGTLPPGIVVETRLDADGARLRGDPTQAFEAVMNLCTNALQAMPGGGRLVVELARRHERAARVLSHAVLPAGDWLVLGVRDQGGGITPEVMERLFEPFFSTRGASGGTGLGLAVVHGVVTEFDGAIDVQSHPGAGAQFTLYLPESGDALTREPPPAPAVPDGAGQTVLVVDDEPPLVALTEELLAGLGYEPVGFSDPAAALQALRDAPQRFDALVTDEVMPGLAGTALARAAREIAPRLPVMLVSGWGGAQLAARASAAGVDRVLAKPLQRAELARALAELLRR